MVVSPKGRATTTLRCAARLTVAATCEATTRMIATKRKPSISGIQRPPLVRLVSRDASLSAAVGCPDPRMERTRYGHFAEEASIQPSTIVPRAGVTHTSGCNRPRGSAPARRRDPQLFERARAGIAVGPPALEPGRVPEPAVLHPVERDLAHERWLEIDPLRVAAGRPSALPARPSAPAEALPALERREQLPELTTLRGLERRRVADVVKDSIAV